VQIEYDVELYGAEKSVQLPFVMGVMADLNGKSVAPIPTVAGRKFLEIDVDNFDDRMKAIKPRAAFSVPNTLTSDGNLMVDLTFEKMDDFSPAAIAAKVEPLRHLLDARTQLAHLVTYMDGKTGAEDLIVKLIADPTLLDALAGVASDQNDSAAQEAILDDLRAKTHVTPLKDTGDDGLNHTATVLANLTETANVSEPERPDTVSNLETPHVNPSDVENVDALETSSESTDFDISSSEPSDTDMDPVIADNNENSDALLVHDDDAEDPIDGNKLLADDDEVDFNTLFDDDDNTDSEDTTSPGEPFGILSAERPEEIETSKKFRIAILGDFSGRASRGTMEIGGGLANRKPIKFDIDNLDKVIAQLATTLVLPIGNDGAGVAVTLNEIEDLHPDELYENVELFEELAALRQRVAMGDGAHAIADMQGWANEFGDLKSTSHKRAKGSAVPADRKLSAFQSLIGDMQGQLVTPSPAADLIARIVGPFVQAAPDPAQPSMLAAIDEALSGAMRTVLHHPDFQTVEATWRSLELLARQIETGPDLDIVLYDVSAEEWAADLSAQDDLADSGLFQMLGEQPRLDDAQGTLSAVFGLYTLEETPPHAELLARMSKISNWMHAPFVTAISSKFLEIQKEDRHTLTAKTWDALRNLPEAKYIGIAAPRFMLRLPYGKKTEPVDPFDFEEFNLQSGLKGMLWANPVVLSAILMAQTVNQKGKNMQLGQVMSIGDMPFHYMIDQYGDQIALPCTERLLNTRTVTDVTARGFIPLLSIKGQNVIRQGSFQALGAQELAGPWGQSAGAGNGGLQQGAQVSLRGTLDAQETETVPSEDNNEEIDSNDDLSDFNFDDGETDDDGDLDDLLADFGDDDDTDTDDDDLDPELAALLEGL
jgi:type VI secretion system ImpB/VipA family protein